MIKSKIKNLSLAFLILALVLISGSGLLAAEDIRQVTDRAGRELEVPAEPQKVIGIGSGALRNVLYFVDTDKIVGVEEGEVGDDDELYRDYQLRFPELRELPQVGPNHGGDAELIAAQEPDLIIHSGDAGEAADLQDKTGVPVVYLDFGDLYAYREVLFEDWELLAKIFQEEERGEELISYVEEIIADLEQRTSDLAEEDIPEVYVGGMSHRGEHGLTSVRVPFPPFEFINADYPARDALDYDTVTQANIDREQLLQWDPEIIFLDASNLHLIQEDLATRPEFSALSAIQEGETYTLLPYSSYHRQFSNILANAYYIGNIIYPEKFADLEPEEKTEEIMEMFLGEPVLTEQKEHFPIYESKELLD